MSKMVEKVEETANSQGDKANNSEYRETDGSADARPSGYDKKISELRQISLESVRIKARYDYELFRYEKMMENEARDFVDRRAEIVREWLQPPPGDGSTQPIYFWLKVLKSSDIGHYIAEDDEPILKHLLDIRGTTIPDEERIHFVIEFHFEPNSFFQNTKLTKTYYSRMLSEWKEPLKYDGFSLDFTLGCTIDWTDQEAERRRFRNDEVASFFDFFNTPEMPENAAEYDGDGDFQQQIDYSVHCFGVGLYIKDFLLPQSILFFVQNDKVNTNPDVDEEQGGQIMDEDAETERE